jgi:hypothetical protein
MTKSAHVSFLPSSHERTHWSCLIKNLVRRQRRSTIPLFRDFPEKYAKCGILRWSNHTLTFFPILISKDYHPSIIFRMKHCRQTTATQLGTENFLRLRMFPCLKANYWACLKSWYYMRNVPTSVTSVIRRSRTWIFLSKRVAIIR